MFWHPKPSGMSNVGYLALVLCIWTPFLPMPLAAQEPQINCQNAMTQYEMNVCAGQDFQAADGDLNATYQLAMNEWFGGRETAHGQALLAAQRAWLAYRDAHCSAEAALFEGGSMQPMIYSFCLAELTRARTETLRSYAEPY